MVVTQYTQVCKHVQDDLLTFSSLSSLGENAFLMSEVRRDQADRKATPGHAEEHF